MLELEVVPERSLGGETWEFVIGMPFSHAVQIVKKQCLIIKKAEVQYCDTHPLLIDLVLNLSQDGFKLIFDAHSQTLKIIEVFNLAKVKLKYCGVQFSSPQSLATIDQIDQSFGATVPGAYDPVNQVFELNFRGLSFSFAIDSKYQPHYTHGLGSLQFSNGMAPPVSRMCIYTGSNMRETKAPPIPLSSFQSNVYVEAVDVIEEEGRISGLVFCLLSEAVCQEKTADMKVVNLRRYVRFGQSEQEVLRELGSPNKVFFKSEDKMKIHSRGAHKLVKTKCSDYFFNYFTMGVDILFSAKTHTVKKFILHTNYPGHYNFNIYSRCQFKIPIHQNVGGDLSSEGSFVITPFTKWDAIQNFLAFPSEDWKPVVMNRASTTNTTNPFGSTFCYGISHFILEVMPNNHIASLTIYSPDTLSSPSSLY